MGKKENKIYRNSRLKETNQDLPIDYRLIRKIKGFINQNSISENNACKIFNDVVVGFAFGRKDSVPIEIFSNRELGAFESIVKYLKENLFLSLSEIAGLTGRSIKTVWTAYSKSRIKRPSAYSIKERSESSAEIPLGIFRDRNLGVQEALVIYLKDNSGLGLSFHDIAVSLKRDDRTVWTAYHRAKKKAGEQETRGTTA